MLRVRQRLCALLPLVLLAAGQALAGAAVSGRLFVDANGNGTFDGRDQPLPKVLVSAWDHTTVTDEQGTYRLELDAGTHLVHPSWPSGVWPARMPFWREVTLAAGGSQTVDFAFREASNRLPFTVVQLTDTHVHKRQVPRMEKLCELINGLKPQPRFVLNTGDLGWAGGATSDAQAEEMWRDHYLPSVAKLQMPVFHAAGNHDYGGIDAGKWEGTDRYVGRGGYRRFCGPLNYAFSHGGWHFIVVEGATPRLPPKKHIDFTVPPETIRWLGAYLSHVSKWEPKILFSHYNPNVVPGNAKDFEELIKGRDFRHILVGHDHAEGRFEFGYVRGSKTAAVCGAWWSGHNPSGDAQGFRLVQVDRDRVMHTAFACPWRDHHVQLVAPDPRTPLRGTAEVTATVFDPKDTVTNVLVGFDSKRELAALTRLAHWKEFNIELNTTGLADGEHELWIVVRRLAEFPTARIVPVIVANAEPQPFAPKDVGRLRLRARKVDAEATVLVNGQKVGTLPAGTTPKREVEFLVSKDILAHVAVTDREGKTARQPNLEPVVTVGFVPGKQGEEPDLFEVSDVQMAYDGPTVHDVRTAGSQFVEIRDVWYLRPRVFAARLRLGGRRRFVPSSVPDKEFEGGIYLRVRPERGVGPMADLRARYAVVSRTTSAHGMMLYEAGKPILHVQLEEPDGAFTWSYVHSPWGIVPLKYHAILTLLSGDETLSKFATPQPR